jgi:hypothetical protein
MIFLLQTVKTIIGILNTEQKKKSTTCTRKLGITTLENCHESGALEI